MVVRTSAGSLDVSGLKSHSRKKAVLLPGKMSVQDWFMRLPARLSTALILSMLGLGARLTAVQLTHSLTVLVDTSHALCRFIALLACIFAIKHEKSSEGSEAEGKLRNTFGWARIEVLAMLVVHVLFASFSLALLLEALQHAVHAAHADPPHAPAVHLAAGAGGLLLHGVNYLLLRGDVMGPGCKLTLTDGGGVVLQDGTERAPRLTYGVSDVVSSLFVISAGIGSFILENSARLADAAICATACIILIAINYPHMRSAGLILLQTVPSGMDTRALCDEVLRMCGVRALKELHVWQLAPGHVVATAHVYYDSPEDYKKYSGDVANVFTGRGISTVALQPEFGEERPPCATACRAPRCCRPDSPPVLATAPPNEMSRGVEDA